MAIEARHLNLFPSHLLRAREVLNPGTENVVPNLSGNRTEMMVATRTERTEANLMIYGNRYGNAVMQRLTKTTDNRVLNLPLTNDSGLNFNRKRPREAMSVGGNAVINRNGNNAFVSVPNGTSAGNVTEEASLLSFLGQDLSMRMMQQQTDFDRIASLHMERLRSEIRERLRTQSRQLFGTIDEDLSKKLQEKEEQIENIQNLNRALENRAKSLYRENQLWQNLAQKHESTAKALRSNLETLLAQANKTVRHRSGEADAGADAKSYCDSSGEDNQEAESERVLRWRKVADGDRKPAVVGGGEEALKKRMCRRCGEAESRVLVLPCRHLCLCSACGPSVDSCPICNSTKIASLHVDFC